MHKIPGKTCLILIALTGSLVACSQDSDNETKAQKGVDSTTEGSATGVEHTAVEKAVPHPDQALIDKAGAPLFDGMGNHHHEITTNNPGAQRYFNQGMVLTFAFNHAEAIRSFKAAQKLDPACAMCYWGEALATGPNINIVSDGKVIMSKDERLSAYAVLQRAVARKGNATQAEQDYIDALQERYDGDVTKGRDGLDQAYATAMGKLTEKYPDDMDAAALYAESLMNTMPWNYWKDDGDPRADTRSVIASLERVLSVAPDHPLAIHLYIHAVEASSSPSRAEKAAGRLAELVPGAGHNA